MAGRMAGHVQYRELETEFGDQRALALCERQVPCRHVLASRPEGPRAGFGHERRHAADVIGVVMGREYRGEREPLLRERGEDRRGIARIHDGDDLRVRDAADHPDIIVAERRSRPHVEHARV